MKRVCLMLLAYYYYCYCLLTISTDSQDAKMQYARTNFKKERFHFREFPSVKYHIISSVVLNTEHNSLLHSQNKTSVSRKEIEAFDPKKSFSNM
jgi:hypothetical protein